jgi:dTDP-4-dehydrorhamnose 3,5-epimerase
VETPLQGAYLVEIEPHIDERGFFARTWCNLELGRLGLDPGISQCSISYNKARNTLRGMHFQEEPHSEVKIVRCTAGRVYDVLVDLRPKSPSFKKWFAYELTAVNHVSLYVPKGIAHGFQTLQEGSEVLYLISTQFQPEFARGVRWDDPAFGIQWPPGERIISRRDQSYPDFEA